MAFSVIIPVKYLGDGEKCCKTTGSVEYTVSFYINVYDENGKRERLKCGNDSVFLTSGTTHNIVSKFTKVRVDFDEIEKLR